MKILIVSPYFPPFSGVGGVRMTSLASYLAEQGNSVYVISGDYSKIYPDMQGARQPEKVDVHYTKVRVKIPGFDILTYREFKKKIDITLTVKEIDFVIITSDPYFTLPLGPYIKKRYGIPYSIEFRDLMWFHGGTYKDVWIKKNEIIKKALFSILNVFYKKAERKSILNANVVIVVDESDRKVLQALYSVNVDVILNGYDDWRLKDLSKLSVSKDPVYFGVFGKLVEYDEDLAYRLFTAVANLKKKGLNIKILHIGKRVNMQSVLIKTGMEESDYIGLGYKDYREGMELLQRCMGNIVLYKHKTGLGTKVFDYIFLNHPIVVISHEQCKLGDFITSFKNGFWASAPHEIECYIEQIVKNKLAFLENEAFDGKVFSRSAQNKIYYNVLLKSISNSEGKNQ